MRDKMENETKQTNLDEKITENETPPTFDQMAELAGLYMSAKNYRANQRVKVHVTALDRQERSAKFGTWQVVYDIHDGQRGGKISLSAMLVKALRDEYGIKDFKDLIGRDMTLLVTQGTSSLQFAIADVGGKRS
jgi:hypothetical protein